MVADGLAVFEPQLQVLLSSFLVDRVVEGHPDLRHQTFVSGGSGVFRLIVALSTRSHRVKNSTFRRPLKLWRPDRKRPGLISAL